jgi:hypothetical protein
MPQVVDIQAEEIAPGLINTEELRAQVRAAGEDRPDYSAFTVLSFIVKGLAAGDERLETDKAYLRRERNGVCRIKPGKKSRRRSPIRRCLFVV